MLSQACLRGDSIGCELWRDHFDDGIEVMSVCFFLSAMRIAEKSCGKTFEVYISRLSQSGFKSGTLSWLPAHFHGCAKASVTPDNLKYVIIFPLYNPFSISTGSDGRENRMFVVARTLASPDSPKRAPELKRGFHMKGELAVTSWPEL